MKGSVLLLTAALQFLLISFVHITIWFMRRKLDGRKHVLLIGSSLEDGILLADKLEKHSQGSYEVNGYLNVRDTERISEAMKEADIILLSSHVQGKERSLLIGDALRQGKEVLTVPDYGDVYLQGVDYQQIHDMWVLSIQPPSGNSVRKISKRVLDLVSASLLLICASPVMVLCSVLIGLTSPGPILYKQERTGLGGQTYQLYKFRSMIHNAESGTGPVLAIADDPRITRFGRFMRATRIDELPQLFNVLSGEMSMVGPRPEREHFIQKFVEQIPEYEYRLVVKPGITGYAQVMANYTTSVEDKLRYDCWYIQNQSLLVDIKILLQTVLVVLRKEQAIGVRKKDQGYEKKILKRLNLHNELAATSEEQK
jgi:exopolysaccharide biosynthesis polyprenyl glycosylphosphotransferase